MTASGNTASMSADQHDGQLLARSVARPEVFVQLFDRHAGRVAAYLYHRGGPSARDELLNDVFVIAFENRHRFDTGRASALPWLLGIATNTVHRRWRDAARSANAAARLAGFANSPHDDSDDIASRLDAEGARPAIVNMLSQLDRAQIDLLVMWTWERLTYAEIAEALDVPVGTVRSRIHRLRGKCVELLGVQRATNQ